MTTLRGFGEKLRAEPPRTLAARVVRRAYQRLGTDLDFPLLPGDLADSVRLAVPAGMPVAAPVMGDRPLRVGWVTTPPGLGSGGHTTMFRMVQALERAGHECVILIYDRHHGATADQEAVIREGWPWVRASVRDVHQTEALAGLDACVATSWPTAHVLASRAAPVHPFYFVQDFEPFFCPRGTEYELALDTYRFPFHRIALGHMVRDRLKTEAGADADLVPFSCDTEVYRRTNTGPRSGVVFYAKPGNPRRGFELGMRTLAELHRRRPDQEIHVYGDPVPDLGFPVTHHGRLTPPQLNELYNRAAAGLALSFTNISLVAEEMLAAGTVPVVNDAADAQADLDQPAVAWAVPTPTGIADALCSVLDDPDPVRRSELAAAGVRTDNWRQPGDLLLGIVEARVRSA